MTIRFRFDNFTHMHAATMQAANTLPEGLRADTSFNEETQSFLTRLLNGEGKIVASIDAKNIGETGLLTLNSGTSRHKEQLERLVGQVCGEFGGKDVPVEKGIE